MVPEKGLEPPRPRGHMVLNHACLPISPLRHGNRLVAPSEIIAYAIRLGQHLDVR